MEEKQILNIMVDLETASTKENAAMMARRAQVSRRNRKQYRDAMFRTLVEKMDLGEELVKAIQRGDETLVTVLEKAVKMVGLHFDQSDEYRQNISVKADNNVKGTLEVTVKGLEDGV